MPTPEVVSKEAGAPVARDEIEITPEMMEAGLNAYAHDPHFEFREDAMARAYRAMLFLDPSYIAFREWKQRAGTRSTEMSSETDP